MSEKTVVLKVRINYKSGTQEEMEVTEMNFEKGTLSWKQPPGSAIRPFLIGDLNNIESIWVVGQRDG